MKCRQIISIIVVTTIFASCHKGSRSNPANNNTNEFQLSFAGKNYDASDVFSLNDSGIITGIAPAGYSIQASIQQFYSPAGSKLLVLYCDIPGHFGINFTSICNAPLSGTGTYTMQGSFDLTDSAAGNAIYTIDGNSTVNVTEADSLWTAGTMNFTISDPGGNTDNATGSFRISARQ